MQNNYKVIHEAINSMDPDLAIQVIMSGLSNDPKRIVKQFTAISQLVATRKYRQSLKALKDIVKL